MRWPDGGGRAGGGASATSAEVMLDGGGARSDQAAAFARDALDRWRIPGRQDVVDAARRLVAVAPGAPIDLRLQAWPGGIRVELICRADAERGRVALREAGIAGPRAGVIGIGRASCAWTELDR